MLENISDTAEISLLCHLSKFSVQVFIRLFVVHQLVRITVVVGVFSPSSHKRQQGAHSTLTYKLGEATQRILYQKCFQTTCFRFPREKTSRMKIKWLVCQIYIWLTAPPPLNNSALLLPRAFLWEPSGTVSYAVDETVPLGLVYPQSTLNRFHGTICLVESSTQQVHPAVRFSLL